MRGARIYYPRVPRLMRDDHRRISSRCVRNRNSSCTTSLDHTRYKTLPARLARRPTRYKTLPARLARRPTRYKTLPARPARRPTRYKTLPASPKTPISAHFSHAGRTLYRFRHQQPEQGELYPACGATSGTKLSQQAALAGPPGTKLSQHARLDGPPGTKLSQQAALAGPPGTKLSQPPGSTAHPVQNSPSKRPWQAHPVQNSPSKPQNADFGPLFACRENFVPLPPPTRQAGRKKSRTNTPPHPPTRPSPNFACNSIE